MLQVVQQQKSGIVSAEEIPAPECFPGGILVRTAFSLISAGTEKTSVSNAKSSLLERARRQPEQVRMVMDFIRKEGILSTMKRVQSTLASFKTLGYSASGIVIESDCDEFAPGDRVACGGAGYANHAEIIAVPRNLAVKVPDSVKLEDASFATVAAIAMQGFRQAGPSLGETVAVIGLGLIGQITVQLLKAAGCRVAGIDLNEALFADALKYGADKVYKSSFDSIESILALTRGIGCDSVIITAGTSSNEPVELALKICRKRGTVVVVGAVSMNIQRELIYKKEIDFKIACSYGPGRYDPLYEEYGVDYPVAYVRWTERRNMQAFIDLLEAGRIDVKSMQTHVFPAEEAARAYDIILGKTPEPFTGILLKYKETAGTPARLIPAAKQARAAKSAVRIGFIGAGTFARTHLIPPVKHSGASLEIVATATSVNAKTAADIFGFSASTTSACEVIANERTNMIFCATRHDTHAKIVIDSLKAGKAVFVEKPLAVSREELDAIARARGESAAGVMVGFNRRFSEPFTAIKKFFASRKDPMYISYRVNAGFIPKSHWTQAPGQGGRIIGEACHFIDTMAFLTGALPVSVYAEAFSASNAEATNHDNVAITIKFSDGSIGVVHYLACGDSSVPKELCEVHCERSSAVMNNFSTVTLHRAGKTKTLNFNGKKGIAEEVAATIEAFKNGGGMPVPFEVLHAVTLATFAANESLGSGIPVRL